jgi:hypothetical protein
MATHTFDFAAWQALFPELSAPYFSEATVTAWWNVATVYLGDTDYWGGLSGAQLDMALNQLTAHLAYSAFLMYSGEGEPVIITSAVIDKVSISTQPPESRSAFDYWLNSTPYGRMLLALLSMLSAGGFVVGGMPELSGFRKIGGGFRGR